MILVVFIIVYLLVGIPLVVWVRMDGTLAGLLAIPVAFALACLFGWLRPRRERLRVAKNRKYLFDLHMETCREYIETIEREGGADPMELKIRMYMIGYKLRDSHRVGHWTGESNEEYAKLRNRFLALQKQYGFDYHYHEV